MEGPTHIPELVTMILGHLCFTIQEPCRRVCRMWDHIIRQKEINSDTLNILIGPFGSRENARRGAHLLFRCHRVPDITYYIYAILSEAHLLHALEHNYASAVFREHIRILEPYITERTLPLLIQKMLCFNENHSHYRIMVDFIYSGSPWVDRVWSVLLLEVNQKYLRGEGSIIDDIFWFCATFESDSALMEWIKRKGLLHRFARWLERNPNFARKLQNRDPILLRQIQL